MACLATIAESLRRMGKVNTRAAAQQRRGFAAFFETLNVARRAPRHMIGREERPTAKLSPITSDICFENIEFQLREFHDACSG